MQKEENYTGPETGVYLEYSRNHKESGVALENCMREGIKEEKAIKVGRALDVGSHRLF